MFCPKCGTENSDSASFCQKCGESLAPKEAKPTGTSVGLEPNVAGLLCYALGWITGLIFFLLQKENKVCSFSCSAVDNHVRGIYRAMDCLFYTYEGSVYWYVILGTRHT